VRLTVGEHIVHVHLDPGFEAVHHLVQGETEVGERVGDRDGHGRCRSPGDQAVTLQGAQCLGEHLLADAGQQAQQRILIRMARNSQGRLHHPWSVRNTTSAGKSLINCCLQDLRQKTYYSNA